MADEIATLAIEIEARDAQANLERLTQGTDNLAMTATKCAAAMAGIVAGSKVVGFFKDAISSASAYREDLAQFEHVMRNVTAQSEEMLKTLTSDQYGRSAQQAMQMTMNLTSMAKGMGIADEKAAELAGEFAKMSVDIGSFLAKDPDAVIDAFSSALMGNTMALRTYGVFLNDATIKTAIAENAKNGLSFATEREARAYAILAEDRTNEPGVKDVWMDWAANENIINERCLEV